MPKIIITGSALLYAEPDSDQPLTDSESLNRAHGLYCPELCVDLMDEDDFPELTIHGGRLRLVHDSDSATLRAVTTYTVDEELTEDEIAELVEFTLAQWSSGIGGGTFEDHNDQILSMSLARVMHSADMDLETLGDLFVDVFPMTGEEEEIEVEIADDEGGFDDEIIEELATAADLGNIDALMYLAERHLLGIGLPENGKLAFDLYLDAAEQGNAVALFYVGYCLKEGIGTDANPERAVECFEASAEEGVEMAMQLLGECYLEGIGVEQDTEKALGWLRQGVELGNEGCMAALGACYEFGKGVDVDLFTAQQLYEDAVELGAHEIEEALERVNRLIAESN